MSTDGYVYIAEVFGKAGESVDYPSSLWRRRGDELEYLSLVDWDWHLATPEQLPHPDLFVPISADQAQVLISDHQRFARYWVLHDSPATDGIVEEPRVYRRLPSTERQIDEVFGRDNTWIPTRVIKEFVIGGPHDVPDLQRIDAATAERLIQETRGITGAIEL